MTMRRTIPLQTTSVPFPQQAPSIGLQAGTVPATATTTTQIDISSIMNLMITMMIVVMMMKMMTGAMGQIS